MKCQSLSNMAATSAGAVNDAELIAELNLFTEADLANQLALLGLESSRFLTDNHKNSNTT